MRSHLFHMLLYSVLVSTFLAVLVRHDTRSRIRLGLTTQRLLVVGIAVVAGGDVVALGDVVEDPAGR